MAIRKRRLILAVCGLFFLALAPILLLYTLGYRIDQNLKIGRIGGLYISSPVSGSEIFVNNEMEKQTNLLQNGMFLQNLKTGFYSVLVAKEGYWTWQKTLEIKEGVVAEARAFLTPMSPKGTVLFRGPFASVWASPYDKILLLEKTRGNQRQIAFYLPEADAFLNPAPGKTTELLFFKKEISEIFWEEGAVILEIDGRKIKVVFDLNLNSVEATPEPRYLFTANHKYERVTSRKKERLWQDPRTNEIWVEWLEDAELTPYYLCAVKPCESSKYLISAFRYPVKNADFFPGRKDIVVAAVQNSVFAMEIDGRSGRINQPIYKGKDPTFALFPDKSEIYVLDDGILYAINLK